MADQSSPGSGNVRRSGFRRAVRREFEELREFMLDEERKKRLAGMARWVRGLYISFWLFKSLFLKLTPTRRTLLIIGLLFLWTIRVQSSRGDTTVNFDLPLLGSFILLFVLALELKDKLVARKELEAGRAVQEALLPPRNPDVPGWHLWLFSRSANEVGGDLVDFVQVSEGRFGVAVGDVAGKGLRAALLTAKLQATLRALVTEFTSLGELGAKLNQIFSRDSLPNLFASLLYLEIQPDSGRIRAVNAGHLPPLIVKGAGTGRMEKGGPALGIVHSATFTEQWVDLERDQLLFVYSDGVTEAQNEQGDFFGEQRLLDLLPALADRTPAQLGEQLVAEVDRFIGDGRPSDDLSIALLKRA